ncbi:MAG: molybdopterin-dependent oxidoreductase, partial [Acidobacteriota bacterium]
WIVLVGNAGHLAVEARLRVLWGVNPSSSGIHLVPWIQAAQRAGARLVAIDPRATPLAKQADLHLALRPGTDLQLALAIHRHLFTSGAADLDFLDSAASGWRPLRDRAAEWTIERAAAVCDVPTADLETFARWYAEISPAVVRSGWGLERNRLGGSACAAVLALPAVAGKFGVRGGGYTASNSAAQPLVPWADPARSSPAPDADRPSPRVINQNRVGRELLAQDATGAPKIRGTFVYNHNPIATLPRQDLVRRGFEREDLFTVVFDCVATDTARYADVVLPATTFLEHRDLKRAYGAYVLAAVEPAMPPRGEARSNVEVFAELLRRTGLARPDDPLDAEAWSRHMRDQLSPDARRALEREGIATPVVGDRPVQMVDVRPQTPDGKIHLFPAALDAEAPAGLYAVAPPAADRAAGEDGDGAAGTAVDRGGEVADGPLVLISPADRRAISSTLFERVRKPPGLDIHPDDAATRDIATGAEVRVFNRFGEVRTWARVTHDVRPGVVSLAKGLWDRHTRSGTTANVLAPDTLTDLGGGACFNDARCEVTLDA